MASYNQYLVDIENHVASVRFNRPHKSNSLNKEAWTEMKEVFDAQDRYIAMREKEEL